MQHRDLLTLDPERFVLYGDSLEELASLEYTEEGGVRFNELEVINDPQCWFMRSTWKSKAGGFEPVIEGDFEGGISREISIALAKAISEGDGDADEILAKLLEEF